MLIILGFYFEFSSILFQTYKLNTIINIQYFELSVMATKIQNQNLDQPILEQNLKSSLNLLSWKTDKNKKKDDLQQIMVLENGQGLYLKQSTQKILLERCIYSKMIGVSSSSKNVSQFVCQPFLIDKYSCAFVVENKIMKYEQKSNPIGVQLIKQLTKDLTYKVYEYLVKNKYLFLLDGHKFGGDFLAYEHNPDSNHAAYLIFIEKNGKQLVGKQQISRLAGVCKKTGLIVKVSMNQASQIQIVQQQVQPRITETRKINEPIVINTPELLLLKAKLGWGKRTK